MQAAQASGLSQVIEARLSSYGTITTDLPASYRLPLQALWPAVQHTLSAAGGYCRVKQKL